MIDGAEGQNRTVDTSLFRAVLYQLSYLGTETKQEAALLQNDRRKSRYGILKLEGFIPSPRSIHKSQLISWRRLPGPATDLDEIAGCLAEREGFEPSVEVLAPTTV